MLDVIEIGEIYQETAGERRFGRAASVDPEGWVELSGTQGVFKAHSRHIQPSQWTVTLGDKSAIHKPSGTRVSFASTSSQQWKLEIPNDKLKLMSTKEKKSFGKEAYHAFLAEFDRQAENYRLQ